jgi:hypothetical protein
MKAAPFQRRTLTNIDGFRQSGHSVMMRRLASIFAMTLIIPVAACGGLLAPSFDDGGAATADDGGSSDDGEPTFIDDSSVDGSDLGHEVDGACNDQTCPQGCCLGARCVGLSELTSSTCGIAGVSCVACAPGATCLKGSCAKKQTACGPGTCAGCCEGDFCVNGESPHACGIGGQLCQGCANCTIAVGGGGTCGPSQTCGTKGCNGCCAGNVCQPGTSVSACGVGGIPCLTCTGGTSCVEGIGNCQLPPFCDSHNCATCCKGNQCMPGTDDHACGEQSNVCVDCTTRGDVCKSQQCVARCSASTCSGCCEGAICAAGNQDIACGTGGAACTSCTAVHATCGASGLCGL